MRVPAQAGVLGGVFQAGVQGSGFPPGPYDSVSMIAIRSISLWDMCTRYWRTLARSGGASSAQHNCYSATQRFRSMLAMFVNPLRSCYEYDSLASRQLSPPRR